MPEYVLAAVLICAGISDVLRGRVPNILIILGAAAGIYFRGLLFLPAAALVLLAGFLLYHLGMMGGGDGKLAALIFGYLGAERGLPAVFASFAVGAAAAVVKFVIHGGFGARMEYLFLYIGNLLRGGDFHAYDDLSDSRSGHTLPFAACLAAGTILYMLFDACV